MISKNWRLYNKKQYQLNNLADGARRGFKQDVEVNKVNIVK